MRYDNPLVHYYLAECYKSMEKFDKAQEQYDIYSNYCSQTIYTIPEQLFQHRFGDLLIRNTILK